MNISRKLYKQLREYQEVLYQELLVKEKDLVAIKELISNIKQHTKKDQEEAGIDKLELEAIGLELEVRETFGKSEMMRKVLYEIGLENQEKNNKKNMLLKMLENAVDDYFEKESGFDEV